MANMSPTAVNHDGNKVVVRHQNGWRQEIQCADERMAIGFANEMRLKIEDVPDEVEAVKDFILECMYESDRWPFRHPESDESDTSFLED